MKNALDKFNPSPCSAHWFSRFLRCTSIVKFVNLLAWYPRKIDNRWKDNFWKNYCVDIIDEKYEWKIDYLERGNDPAFEMTVWRGTSSHHLCIFIILTFLGGGCILNTLGCSLTTKYCNFWWYLHWLPTRILLLSCPRLELFIDRRGACVGGV